MAKIPDRITIRISPVLLSDLKKLAGGDDRKPSTYAKKVLADHVKAMKAAKAGAR